MEVIDLFIEHSEIAEMSNEIDTNDQKSKEKNEDHSGPISSSSKESDYLEEDTNPYRLGVVASPVVKPLDPTSSKAEPQNKVHPFMLEGVVEDRRRMSSVVSRNSGVMSMISTPRNRVEDSARDLDENYMMFGGDMYTKVRLISKFWVDEESYVVCIG